MNISSIVEGLKTMTKARKKDIRFRQQFHHNSYAAITYCISATCASNIRRPTAKPLLSLAHRMLGRPQNRAAFLRSAIKMYLCAAGHHLLGREQQTGLVSALEIISGRQSNTNRLAHYHSRSKYTWNLEITDGRGGGYTAFSALSIQKSDGKHSVPYYSTLFYQSGSVKI